MLKPNAFWLAKVPVSLRARAVICKGGHVIVTLNGRRSVLPMHGGSKEIGKGLWRAILKQLDITE